MQQTTTFDEAFAPTDGQLEELADRALALQKRLPEDNKPVVIEFAGSPKSGKSTTIDVVAHFFKRMGFKVRAPSEGASKRTPYHLRRELVAFNSWTLNYAISELLDSYHNVEPADLVILDRGPFDSLAWLELLRENENLPEDKKLPEEEKLGDDEFKTMQAFALVPRWAELVSRIYLFTCEPSVSLEREHSAKLTRRSGTAMNEPMLSSLRDQYARLERTLNQYPVRPFDTSKTTSALGTAYLIVEDLLSCLDDHDQ